jgi:hypothetical protein
MKSMILPSQCPVILELWKVPNATAAVSLQITN